MIRHNHIGIWLLVAAHLILTVLWYSPLLFYYPWIQNQYRDMSKPTNDPLPFITGIFSIIIMCYAISWMVQVLNRTTWKQGFQTGLLLFFGFAGSSLAFHYKYLDIKNIVLLIDLGLSFVLIVGTSGILAVWRKKE